MICGSNIYARMWPRPVRNERNTGLRCNDINQIFAYTKTKTQISCAITAELISAFVFATQIAQSLYFLNFKPLAILCGRTARFVWDLVENPEYRFLTTRLNYCGVVWPSRAQNGVSVESSLLLLQ